MAEMREYFLSMAEMSGHDFSITGMSEATYLSMARFRFLSMAGMSGTHFLSTADMMICYFNDRNDRNTFFFNGWTAHSPVADGLLVRRLPWFDEAAQRAHV